MPNPLPALNLQEQKSIILNIFADFCIDADTMRSYLDHIGFDIGAISHPRELRVAYLGHYKLRNGTYDVEKACKDFACWPPVAAEIRRLKRKTR